MKGCRTGEPDRQDALVATPIVSGRFHRKVNIPKNCPGFLDECPASLRDLDTARHPPEQCRADHRLQASYLLAEWGLLDTKPLGGARDMPLVSDDDGVSKMAKLNHDISPTYEYPLIHILDL
jgi:hypothetical protein